MQDLQNIKTSDLLQMYSNAWATGSCLGHFKGQQNDFLVEKYATELEARGVLVPKNTWQKINGFETNVEIPEGIYNGEGAF